MNNDRRKRINEALAAVDTLHAEIESIRDEEQEAYDNLPESIQNNKRGEKIQKGINALKSAVIWLETCKDDLEGIQ